MGKTNSSRGGAKQLRPQTTKKDMYELCLSYQLSLGMPIYKRVLSVLYNQ